MKPSTPVLHSPRLLDQLRECLRYRHYSHNTEKSYVYWVRLFVRWSARASGAMRHPRGMGAADVQAFLTMSASERHVSGSTHNQALSALLFLYRHLQPAGCLGLALAARLNGGFGAFIWMAAQGRWLAATGFPLPEGVKFIDTQRSFVR